MKPLKIMSFSMVIIICLYAGHFTSIFAEPYDFSSIPDNSWVKLNPELYNYKGELVKIGSPDSTTLLSYPKYIFPWNAFSGMVYNSDDGTILMFGGGGHGGRTGNDVWVYDISQNEWHQQYMPDPKENYPNQGAGKGLDRDQYQAAIDSGQWLPPGSTKTGRPWTSHSYDQLAYDPVNHEMLFFGPNFAFDYEIPYYLQAPYAYAYNPSTKSWRFINQNLDVIKQMGAMEYYPPTKEIILNMGGTVWSYDTLAKTWKKKNKAPAPLLDAVMVYDSINQQLLLFGSDYPAGNDLWAYDPETDSWTEKALNSTSKPPPGPCGAAFDSLNGVMIIWGESDTGEFHPTWAYDAMTDQWEKMDPPVEPPSDKGHVFGHMAYDPIHNVIIMIDRDGATWVYRYRGGSPGPVPPPQPIPEPPPVSIFITHTLPVQETTQSKPPVGIWWTDPDLGGQIMRLHGFTEQGESGHHVYSDLSAWSTNMSYYAIIVNESSINIYNWPDRTLKRENIGLGTGSFYFSNTDDDVLFYFSGSRLMQYRISNDSKSTVKDFSSIFSYLSSPETKIGSNDGRYFVIPGTKLGGGQGVVVWDSLTNSIGNILNTGNECVLSPDGRYILELGARSSTGILRYDAMTMENPLTLDINANYPHSDVIKDSRGEQWVVYQRSLDGKLCKASIDNGGVIVLLSEGYLNYHISARHIKSGGDWVVASFFTRKSQRDDGPDVFEDEIVRVYLDSIENIPHVERLVKHRSEALGDGEIGCYWKQPHASVSPDGRYVIFESDWRSGCIVGSDLVDPYVINLLSPIDTNGVSAPANLRIVTGG